MFFLGGGEQEGLRDEREVVIFQDVHESRMFLFCSSFF